MKLRISITPKTFWPAFTLRTSRGTISQKTSYFVLLQSGSDWGLGEGAPLPGLSLDGEAEWQRLQTWLDNNPDCTVPDPGPTACYTWAKNLLQQAGLAQPSSLRYALETAALSITSGEPEVYFRNAFTLGNQSLEINGLVWMDDLQAMYQQGLEKARQGFTTIKFKIGSHAWADELALLQSFRKQYPADAITIRVDANGAFSPDQALRVMDDLARLQVHSIEQPIRQGQHNAMRRLVAEGATPIGLDEELITAMPWDELQDMVAYIHAPYLILKPTLIGGLERTANIIALAAQSGSQWWLTSSLETPIGLTALAQFAAEHKATLPQGLSTGKVYQNELAHPNCLQGKHLIFDPDAQFNLDFLTGTKA